MRQAVEEEEVRRFVQGSRSAFEALVLRHRKAAVGFARQYVGDDPVAEDLVQDCFAHLYVYPDRFDFRSSFKTYLYTLIRHKCVDYLRKRERRRERALPDGRLAGKAELGMGSRQREWTDGMREPSDPAPGPEERALARESWQVWQTRLGELREGDRRAVYLVDVEGLAPQEAAAVLGKSGPGFRVALHRARRRLREIAEKGEQDDERREQGTPLFGRQL
ncbi:RNA polymerase sigma factor [Gorillibacterium sp. sgz500922]|uniref:RNA polymerase sigma factor n=1 Tax=Gorillibacterium sp. sgz500922 TaxID=3446694 RepID=UPI003F66AB86